MTAKGSRGIFSTPDAVTDLRDMGDRLDMLERIPAATTDSLLDAYAWELTIPGDDTPVFGGRLSFPAGFSKMDFVGGFASLDDEEILGGGAGIVFEGDFESTNVVAGGITSATPLSSQWLASGFALIRCSGPKKVRFYPRAYRESGGDVYTRGALFVNPVRSVAFVS